MKFFYSKLSYSVLLTLVTMSAFAGNGKRVGQSGATELLINPWARSSGFAGTNTSNVIGIESLNQNVAGLAQTIGTEVGFSRTNWLVGSDININTFGLAQRIGESGVLGASVFSMDFGNIDVTTENNPSGGLGTYNPQLINIALSYGHSFSSNIHTGVTARVIDESTTDASATGACLDAGIQYVTGAMKNIKIGISLRNVGAPMKFNGSGLAFKYTNNANGAEITATRKADQFELPTQLMIGGSYDLYTTDTVHRLTATANFTSNSFSNDLYGIGGEYGYKNYFMLRAGYNYQDGMEKFATSQNAFYGFNAGLTIEVPLNKKGTAFGFDYSYRMTAILGGTHSYGVRLNF